MDTSLTEAGETTKVLKGIHVGPLCAQEVAVDRPTMNSIAGMLVLDHAFQCPINLINIKKSTLTIKYAKNFF
jgi:hypothetical protein